jgi:lactate racemase
LAQFNCEGSTCGGAGVTALVKPGGKILLIATCEEGSGGKEFSKLLAEHRSDRNFMERILHSSMVVDQWQQEKLGLVTRITKGLYHVPGLPHEFQSSLWGKPYPTPDAAVQALTSELAPGATIGVIPEGLTFRPVPAPDPTDCGP